MRHVLLIALFLQTLQAFPQSTTHKDITIESLKEKIEFEKGSKTNPVLIKHSFETFYLCNDYCTSTL